MSIKLVSAEIKRFLSSSEPEVLCIMGKWGAGKTFTWKHYLKNAVDSGEIALKRYSYTTLFGINSIETIRSSIFENTIDVDELEAGPTTKTFKKSLTKIRGWSKIVKYIPQAREYASGLFLTVRKQIVCIDDLERMADGVTAIEVLGLISFLKTERKCKVVLLLNNEVLAGDDKEDFKNQLEKVVDVDIKFEPTALEAVDIGINKDNIFSESFARICVSLNIINIRVIKKIERLLINLYDLLKDHDKRIFENALPSVVLIGWSVFEESLAPDIEYIKNFNVLSHLFYDKKENEKEKAWRVKLSSINFSSFDEFDTSLLKSIESGYFDTEEVEKQALRIDKELNLQDQDTSFHDAWEGYHKSFETNDDQVLDNLFSTFQKCIQSIDPTNLDGTTMLFRKMGRGKQADKMIELYMTNRNEKKEFYDIKRSVFSRFQDSAIVKAFEKKYASFIDARTPESIIMNIAQTSSWNPEDIEALAKLSADDFYNMFKKNPGPDLRIYVSQALKFKNYNPSTPDLQKVGKSAEEALLRIADESPMNRERVEMFGVSKEEKGIKE